MKLISESSTSLDSLTPDTLFVTVSAFDINLIDAVNNGTAIQLEKDMSIIRHIDYSTFSVNRKELSSGMN